MRTALSRGVAAVGALGLVSGVLAAVPAEAATSNLTLLAFNDFHGRISAAKPSTVGFCGTIEEQRLDAGAANTVLLSGGDNIGASLFPSFSQDEIPSIEILNAIGVDASAAGNHEFDRGFADLTDRVDPAADFEHLAANVYRKGTQTPAMEEYTIIDRAGVKVGVIGVAPQTTGGSVNPDGVSTIEFGDPVAAVNRVARQLSDGDPANGEADVIVANYHEGSPVAGTLQESKNSAVLFQRIVDETDPSVDVIFNGHTHRLYNYDAPIPGTDRTRPVIQSGYYASHVGRVDLTVTDGEVTAHVAKNFESYAAPADVPAAVQASAPYQACKTRVDQALAEAEVKAAEPVGYTTEALTRASTDPNSMTEDRASESTMTNFVANMLRDRLAADHLGGAVIGLQNPGGTRADWDAGVITYGEAASVLPFANTLVTTTLTGAQFKQVLEEQWQPEGASRPFLNLGVSDNVNFTYDPERAKGDRITSVSVDGKPLDPNASYVIGTMSFLAGGGDSLFTLAEGTDVVDLGLLDMQEFVGYIESLSDPSGTPAISPDYRKRGVVVSVNGADKTAPVAPVEVPRCTAGPTLDVDKLDFTSIPSVKNTDLVATIGDVEVGTATVTDGAAQITIDAQAVTDTSATEMVLTANPTGTVVRVPITISNDGCPVVAQPTVTVAPHSVKQGATVTITGKGFQPGEAVVFTIHSTPVTLPAVKADANGVAVATWTVPATFDVGSHRVVATADSGVAETTMMVVAGDVAEAPGQNPVEAPTDVPAGIPNTGC